MDENNSFKKFFRSIIKHGVFHCALIRIFFIFLYHVRGKKPWGIGYSIYKFHFVKEVILNQPRLFLEKKLPARYGFRMDERVIEYPWLFLTLKERQAMILDAGSVLNHELILTLPQLRARKIYISTLAHEGFQYTDPPPSYVTEDIREMCYKNDFFDAVVCLSTLEHVGMDNTFLYTQDQNKNENDRYAYVRAVRELKRVLKKDGTLYVSVPYGRYKNHGWLQVFDGEMVQRLVQEFSPREIVQTFFKYENNQWDFSSEASCRDGHYFDVHNAFSIENNPPWIAAQCVLCLALTK